jgi:UDP-N-acetylmuramoyl-tripeptide--D-alanyl-D-alanine ligase
MIALSIAEIVAALSARGVGIDDDQLIVSGAVTTDSREVTAGGIFFAKPGEFTDGHEFVSDALERGAVLAVVEREQKVPIAQLVVTDSVAALGQLAELVLSRVRSAGKLRVIGITGSNGKTSTKNMLRAILQSAGPTVAPRASYNNEVGAPTTVLELEAETEFLITELGAAGPGSISRLAKLVSPDIGVELKVGMAHAGVFGGIENTAKIKAELLAEVREFALLNYDDSWVREMQTPAHCERVGFGFATDSNFRLLSVETGAEGTTLQLQYPDGEILPVLLRVLGEHQAMNAAAALAVAELLGVDRAVAVAALESLPLAERWRMEPIERRDGVLVINDAYNASPDSMRAALQTLATIGRSGRRTVAVLGEMAELGEFAVTEHDAIGRLVVRLNIDQLYVVGEAARLIHMGAVQEGSWASESQFFATIDAAFDGIRGKLQSGDVVLVKSSNSAELRFLGDRLAEAD